MGCRQYPGPHGDTVPRVAYTAAEPEDVVGTCTGISLLGPDPSADPGSPRRAARPRACDDALISIVGAARCGLSCRAGELSADPVV